jgi:putative NADPH-quinone reductase
MRIQVVHCHPLTDSYDHALYLAIIDALRINGHEAIGTDLYREGFDPVMTEAERRSYMGNDYDTSAIAAYVDLRERVREKPLAPIRISHR